MKCAKSTVFVEKSKPSTGLRMSLVVVINGVVRAVVVASGSAKFKGRLKF